MPKQTSVWRDELLPPSLPVLQEDRQADVSIVGGGLTGIVTAFFLVREGKKVILIEKERLGEGDTAYTTAFLTEMIDAPLTQLSHTWDEDTAGRVWRSQEHAISLIERLIKQIGIDADFRRCDEYFFSNTQDKAATLQKEFQLAQKLHLPVDQKGSLPFAGTDFFMVRDQATFHPLKFIFSLAKRAQEMGVEMYEGTHLHEIEAGHPHTALTSGGRIRAEHIILATHSPINNRFEGPARLVGKITYVIEVHAPSQTLPAGLYLDNEEPYHYLRVDPCENYERLILGGEDHVVGTSDDADQRFSRLQQFGQRLLPSLDWDIRRAWSGEVYESADGLPYIGESSFQERQYIATGYAGNGMTFGTLAGSILCDAVLGRKNAWSDLYVPARVHGIGVVASQGFKMAKQLIKERVQAPRLTVEQIEPGSGGVVEEEGETVAIYKKQDGTIVRLSPVCTHLGCHVHWNSQDATWDCPCHGSRFHAEGEVLNGPAVKPLRRT
jgi:glycine/D-amino acid oxidase-like deaminating enzyme/nitrite reductase/ring-hydroxylating ferredoxin subunit